MKQFGWKINFFYVSNYLSTQFWKSFRFVLDSEPGNHEKTRFSFHCWTMDILYVTWHFDELLKSEFIYLQNKCWNKMLLNIANSHETAHQIIFSIEISENFLHWNFWKFSPLEFLKIFSIGISENFLHWNFWKFSPLEFLKKLNIIYMLEGGPRLLFFKLRSPLYIPVTKE